MSNRHVVRVDQRVTQYESLYAIVEAANEQYARIRAFDQKYEDQTDPTPYDNIETDVFKAEVLTPESQEWLNVPDSWK